MSNEYTIFPLGDSAISFELGNTIHEGLNDRVLAMQRWLRNHPFDGCNDVVTAYSSLSVFYDPLTVRRSYPASSSAFEFLFSLLELAWDQTAGQPAPAPETIRIPVCYAAAFAPDLDAVALEKGISREEIAGMHCALTYRVFMIGFLPGFAYMGQGDERLSMPRKTRNTMVMPGSVGIMGRQTAIYPVGGPGGWFIIGRTPLRLFDAVAKNLVLLKAGNLVEFYPINAEEFGQLNVL